MLITLWSYGWEWSLSGSWCPFLEQDALHWELGWSQLFLGKNVYRQYFWLFLSSLCFDKVFVQWFPCMNSILLIFILRTEEIVGYGFCLGTIQLTNLEQRETKIKLSLFRIIWLDSPWDAVPYLFCKGSYLKINCIGVH